MTQAVTALKQHEEDGQSSEMLAEYLGPLRVFLDDESLTEICINRPREVWTEGREGWQRHDTGIEFLPLPPAGNTDCQLQRQGHFCRQAGSVCHIA